VDDVERVQLDADVLPEGITISGVCVVCPQIENPLAPGAMSCWIRELPAPLHGVDLDRRGGARHRGDLVLDDDGAGEQREDDHDRDDRVGDLQRQVVLGLTRRVPSSFLPAR